jgi:FkbM family methyltransferase
MTAAARFSVFRTLVRQVGPWRALKLSALKAARRIFQSEAQIHLSQTGEDLVIQHLIDTYLGPGTLTYADVGCNDPVRISSSYLLYLRGHSGIAIDMNHSYAARFRAERPNDIFVNAAVSDQARTATRHDFSVDEVSTIDEKQALMWDKHWIRTRSSSVQTTTLSRILAEKLGDRSLDLLLMDIEGHERQALEGADLANYRPRIIVCEIHDLDLESSSDDEIVAMLRLHGYCLVAYATMNAYFVREDTMKGRKRSRMETVSEVEGQAP